MFLMLSPYLAIWPSLAFVVLATFDKASSHSTVDLIAPPSANETGSETDAAIERPIPIMFLPASL